LGRESNQAPPEYKKHCGLSEIHRFLMYVYATTLLCLWLKRQDNDFRWGEICSKVCFVSYRSYLQIPSYLDYLNGKLRRDCKHSQFLSFWKSPIRISHLQLEIFGPKAVLLCGSGGYFAIPLSFTPSNCGIIENVKMRIRLEEEVLAWSTFFRSFYLQDLRKTAKHQLGEPVSQLDFEQSTSRIRVQGTATAPSLSVVLPASFYRDTESVSSLILCASRSPF
jgi:hypothetical protein